MRDNKIKKELSDLIEMQINTINLSGSLISWMIDNTIQILGLAPIEWAVRFEYNINHEHPEKWFNDHYAVTIQSLIDGKEEINLIIQDGEKTFHDQSHDKESITIGSLISEIKKETLHNDIMKTILNSKDLDLVKLLESIKKELNLETANNSSKYNSQQSNRIR